MNERSGSQLFCVDDDMQNLWFMKRPLCLSISWFSKNRTHIVILGLVLWLLLGVVVVIVN